MATQTDQAAAPKDAVSELTRRTLLKGAATLAGAAALTGMSVSQLPELARAHERHATENGGAKPNVLLVHGAWADGSSWRKVIPLLTARGHRVLAVQISLSSLADDVARVRQVLVDRLQGPTVMVGHSYGGAVISGAATGVSNVISLVFASAFAPNEGETIPDLLGRVPPAPAAAHLQFDSRGFAWLDPAAFREVFCQDVEPDEASVLAEVQRPIAGAAFTDPAGPAAWRTLPSWYLVSENDRTIPPDLERFMAARMGATTVAIRSSHASPVAHPKAVADLILEAAGS